MPIRSPGACFIFRQAAADRRIKLLAYDGQGLWLATKRLSKGRFKWWPTGSEPAKTLRAHQAQLLLAGREPGCRSSATGMAAGERVKKIYANPLAFRFPALALWQHMPAGMSRRYRGRTVTTEEIDFIRGLIAAHPRASRRRLSEKLCEAWQWKQANGAPREHTALPRPSITDARSRRARSELLRNLVSGLANPLCPARAGHRRC